MIKPVISLRIVAAVLLVACQPLRAQIITSPNDTTAGQPLFTGRDVVIAAGFAGLTVAMFPLDKSLARRLSDERSRANGFINWSSKTVENIADPGTLVIGPALYLYGRLANHPDIEDLGWHGTEAVILGGTITTVLKGLAGRARPYASADTNARDFKFGKGFGNDARASFPSGHTTVAFAAASAVTSEVQRIWPGHNWLVIPAMYGGATLVGVSRMYHDKHWASDVALGAAVGTFSGLKVVRYAHNHPRNFLDRAILRISAISTSRSGAALAISLSP